MSQHPVRPSGVAFHLYIAAFTILVGVVFGAAWAFLPLALGLVALVAAEGTK